MSKWWTSATAVAALVIGLAMVAPQPAHADTTTDGCRGTDGPPDLATATFIYSATSFSVGSGFCPEQQNTYGEYLVTLHLTSFTPEVQVTAAFQDLGKYLGYSGYRVCTEVGCGTAEYDSGFLTPPGTRLDGPCLYEVYNCRRDVTSAYGGWADVLPAGTAIPDTISWYAEARVYDLATHDFTTVTDRVPDSGMATATRNTATIATRMYSAPGLFTPIWEQYGTLRTDGGGLSTADGAALAGRLVQISPVRYDAIRQESTNDGLWTSTYAIDRNTTVRACFTGDGVHDPSCTSPYLAGVKAFVSLNLPQSTSVRRGGSLLLQGVVRPAPQTGQVRVLVREDRPGTRYRLLRYTNLAQNHDSYYRITWSPTVRGRYVLRTLWNGGSTAAGAVQSNISDYRRVTVT
jgi:hypothetical protein